MSHSGSATERLLLVAKVVTSVAVFTRIVRGRLLALTVVELEHRWGF